MPQHFLISTVDFEQAIVCWINENADEKKCLKTDNRKKEGSNIDEERSGEKRFCKCKQKCAGEKKHGNWNAVKLKNVISATAFLKVNVKNNHAYKKQLIKNQICLL